MHPRKHFLVSTLAALAVSPRRQGFPWVAWAASILADADHYLWYSVHTRRLNPLQALQHFQQEEEKDAPAGRLLFHRPSIVLLALALGVRSRFFLSVAEGLLFHNALDMGTTFWRHVTRTYRRRRWRKLQTIVFAREHDTCQHCGISGVPLELHHRLPEALGGRNHPDNLLALCRPCHDRAHGRIPRQAIDA